MAEAITPTPAPGTKTEVKVQGTVVGDPADAKAREAKQKEADDRAAKAAADEQKKEQDFFDGAIEHITKYFHENTVSNRRRDDFVTRLSKELRNVRTVAAASKVRGPGVVEVPAESGPGVQVKPLVAVAAGKNPPSGASMPTANPVKAPGTDHPNKVEGVK